METSAFEAKVITDASIVQKAKGLQAANASLMKEGFKVETLLGFMNNCADQCELRYYESGISDARIPEVECYKNCLAKSFKLATTQ